MKSEQATLAYSMALLAVEAFTQNYSSLGLRGLLRNPEQLPAITTELDRRLGL
jgi:hypothetical protein